jgi:hypothetical protein
METKRNKRAVEDIDETFLLNFIAEQGIVKEAAKPAAETANEEKAIPTPEPPPEKSKEAKEPARHRRNPSGEDYGSRFFGCNEFKTRQCVYISRRIHATISEIVRYDTRQPSAVEYSSVWRMHRNALSLYSRHAHVGRLSENAVVRRRVSALTPVFVRQMQTWRNNQDIHLLF